MTRRGAPGFKAELWIKKAFGFRASRYSSDVDALTAETSDFTSLDFMWRPFSPGENNFVAVGVGWQESDLGNIGLASDTSGARINVEGRIAVAGIVYFYGQGSYLPELDDAQSVVPGESFADLSGHEYEVHISHAALTERFKYLVMTECLADHTWLTARGSAPLAYVDSRRGFNGQARRFVESARAEHRPSRRARPG